MAELHQAQPLGTSYFPKEEDLKIYSSDDAGNFALFDELEEKLQPVFKKIPVAHLGFLAISNPKVFNQYMKDDKVYGSNLALYPPTGNIFKNQPEGYALQPSEKDRGKLGMEVKDMSDLSDFIYDSAQEQNAFVHELIHVGHRLLANMQKQAIAGISESTVEGLRNPKKFSEIEQVTMATHGQRKVGNYGKMFPFQKIVHKVLQLGNEKANLIFRLSGRRETGGSRDSSALTESLAFLNTYDSVVSDKSNFEGYGMGLQKIYNKQINFEKFNAPVYNLFHRTTNPYYVYDAKGNPEALDYASDKDYVKDLRRMNKLLNEVASDVLADIKLMQDKESAGFMEQLDEALGLN